MTLVEAAVDTLQSALIAERAGASRIELCADLSDGGTTPSAGLISEVVERVAIPVFVMVRPRGGGFVYSSDEIAVMHRDIEIARREKADGIVTGALDSTGRIDTRQTRELLQVAQGMPVTFHRAFDFTPDPGEALEHLIAIGVNRVLTSGGAPTALEGVDTIARLVQQSHGRITVMAGGGVRENNVREIVTRTGVSEVHSRTISEERMRALVDLANGRA